MRPISSASLVLLLTSPAPAQGPGDTPDWTVSGSQSWGRFGSSAAAGGDLNDDGFGDVVVGAIAHDGAAGQDVGAVFVYYGGPSGPSELPGLTIEGASAGEAVGYAVHGPGDVDGDGVDDRLVGAPGYRDGQNGEGAVFLFRGPLPDSGGTISSASADWLVESDLVSANLFGSAIETLDVNGDGFRDLLVGSPSHRSPSGVLTGAVFLFHGSAGGFNGGVNANLTDADHSMFGTSALENFGQTVVRIGRSNGDDREDFAVGSPNYATAEGRVTVFQGQAGNAAPLIANVFDGVVWMGLGMAGGTDLDLDGFDDLVVGSPGQVNGRTAPSVVYFGGAAGLSRVQTLSGLQFNEQFGHSIACPGDLTGDGFPDVVIGAPSFRGFGAPDGRVYLFEGNASGVSSSPTWSDSEGFLWSGRTFGEVVAGAGDTDGDQAVDLLISCPTEKDENGVVAGRAWLYSGSGAATFEGRGGLDVAPDQVVPDPNPTPFSGYGRVLAKGDVNGDGFEDVVVGDRLQSGSSGGIWLHLGSATGLDPLPHMASVGDQNRVEFGASVAMADTNGDGFDDVVVGAAGRIDTTPGNWSYIQGYVRVYFGDPLQVDPSTYWEARSSRVDHLARIIHDPG